MLTNSCIFCLLNTLSKNKNELTEDIVTLIAQICATKKTLILY